MVGRSTMAAGVPNRGKDATNLTTSPNLFTDEFEAFLKDISGQWNSPGVSLAILDGENTYAKAYGHPALPDAKATPEALYFTGSTTKAYTTGLLSHLINSKEYPELSKGWDTPISSILGDDFVLQDEWATNNVTLRDASGHITGMSRHDISLLRQTNGAESTNRDFVRNMRHLPFVTQPRTKFQYSNYMYFTLSHVIETVTGKPLEDNLRQHVFEPLGMNATFLNIEDAEKTPEPLATSYIWSKEDQKFKEISHMPSKQLSGAGGIISNVYDYAKWLKALCQKSDFFNETTHKEIRSSISIVASSDASSTLYGLGWMRKVIHGQVAYIHNGSTGTFGTYVIWLPKINFGVVAFSNGFETSVPVTNILAMRLVDDKLGAPESERTDFNKQFKESTEEDEKDFANATDILYPTRPKSPVPSTLSAKQLAGKYHHAGYGTHHLKEMKHPDGSGESVLVSKRPDTVFPVRVRFEHVSGDYWKALMFWLPTNTSNMFQAVQFKYGVDGKPSGFEMSIESRSEGVVEGKVLFERID